MVPSGNAGGNAGGRAASICMAACVHVCMSAWLHGMATCLHVCLALALKEGREEARKPGRQGKEASLYIHVHPWIGAMKAGCKYGRLVWKSQEREIYSAQDWSVFGHTVP